MEQESDFFKNVKESPEVKAAREALEKAAAEKKAKNRGLTLVPKEVSEEGVPVHTLNPEAIKKSPAKILEEERLGIPGE